LGKPSAIGQPARPVVPSGECLQSKVRMVVWWVCDPVNKYHSVALRDCLGRKNALYKYLILYFTLKPGLVASYDLRPGNRKGLYWKEPIRCC